MQIRSFGCGFRSFRSWRHDDASRTQASSAAIGPNLRGWRSVRARGLARFEAGEAFAGEGGFFGAGEIVDEVLEPGLGERGLLEVDERQRFLVECGRNLVGSRIVRLNFLEFLHRLLERLVRFVTLAGVGEAAREREVGLADPVLGAAGELVIRVASQELAESRDRERIASLAEVDVRRLVDVLRLQRAGRRPRGY